ncbi:integrin beta-1-binding protein 1 isoform X4 [Bufo bufo]|uniref:integrin beta-1-binding protein 1 isoform X4 n=1 Tax=Bufo bufo TaxID=8384 RepID=UPI001ABE68E3|nr:integrin beta-1-binding protein 1 isoform X4 [Bufo bufo]
MTSGLSVFSLSLSVSDSPRHFRCKVFPTGRFRQLFTPRRCDQYLPVLCCQERLGRKSGWNCDKRMFRKGKKRHSSSSSQSSEISTKSKSVDSSLGGLSRSSTVASLDTDSTKSFGQASSNSEPCAEFKVKYVGSIERVKPEDSKTLQGSLDLINYIDVAQQDGKLPFVPSDEDFNMVVSKYGIKVTTLDQYEHAQSICKVLSTAFDSVLTEKTRVPPE